jgi:uncharacterized protein DUF6916
LLTRRRFGFILAGLVVLRARRSSAQASRGSKGAGSVSLEGPLSQDVFRALVGEEFSLLVNRPAALTLTRVDDDPKRPDGGQFTVTFRGAPDLVLGEGTYRVTHATAGTTELHLRPRASKDQYTYYEAAFNLLPPNAAAPAPVREMRRFERPLYEPPPPPRR